MKDKPHDHPTFALRGKYNNYKPLKAPIGKIIKDIRAVELMQFPLLKKGKFPLANNSKCCKIHKDYGHDTNDCVMLKYEIESLIRNGKLVKYIRYNDQ